MGVSILIPVQVEDEAALLYGRLKMMSFKAVSHRTQLGTRFQYGILGYTRVDWYEY